MLHLSPWLLWAQTIVPGVPPKLVSAFLWARALGVPGFTIYDFGPYVAGLINWVKVIALFAAIGWLLSWVVAAYRTRESTRGDVLDFAALGAVGVAFVSVVLNVLLITHRVKSMSISGYQLADILSAASGVVLLLWTERALWTSIWRVGKFSDGLVLAGLHLAIALGMVVSYVTIRAAVGQPNAPALTTSNVIQLGGMLSSTYMGYVVLVKVLWLLIPELVAIRPRRLFAVARHSVIEATRKMWAPWVVIVLFAVILAFTHWFLPASQQRPAEMGRIFVGTLSLLCMLLLTIMVTVLAPLSLPQDIQAQTIYTVVTKPVRRLELIWGRMLGYMTIVTALVLIFGLISLVYLSRNIGGQIDRLVDEADKIRATEPERAKYLDDEAEQIRTRMSARVPVKGSLSFIDSKSNRTPVGIDVGQELEFRSHIEGGTPSAAIWSYGYVPDPFDQSKNPRRLHREIPVASLLVPGTIEALENDALVLEYGVKSVEQQQKEGKIETARAASQVNSMNDEVKKLRDRSRKLRDEYDKKMADAKALDDQKKPDDADAARRDAQSLHSPPIPMEMTFTVYRTTKGKVLGEPVFAALEVISPNVPNLAKFRDTFPIREYYTNKRYLPSSYLVGSLGALTVTVQCMSATQYLGMAESDFYFLAESGNFGQNFMKGLLGIWLQAMVLTAIGVFAGTFLSWPVALLFTIAFFVAGHAAFSILRDFFYSTMVGGGPFESLIRLVTHDNQVSELAATPGVIVAKTFDQIVVPLMQRMVYLIPNLAALDVTNTVSEGYAVGWPLIIGNALVALAYAIPFSIAGYFILKNREVAA